MKSGFEKPDQQLAPMEVTFHPKELELGGSGMPPQTFASPGNTTTEGQGTGKVGNTATQFPPRIVSHWRTTGDDVDYSSSKMPMTG